MSSVFLSGSRAIEDLSEKVRDQLDKIIDAQETVLVGDAKGADKLFQEFFAERGYDRVMVYCSGTRSRNNVGEWERKMILVGPGLKGREFYAVKDRMMARDADRGLILWDGKSLGSIQNALELLKREKPSTLFLSPSDQTFSIATLEDLRPLTDVATGKARKVLETSLESLDSQRTQEEVIQLTLGF